MRVFRYLLIVSTFLLVSLIFPGPQSADAQELAPATITSFEITTLDNRPVREAPLMAGATYIVNFTIEVAAGLKEDCVLKTSLVRASGSDRFWTLKGDYPGIDSESWQPGQPTISFEAVAGTAQLELMGTVPSDYLSQDLADGQTVQLGKKIPIIELSLESGIVVVDREFEVINTSIEEYRSVLDAKKALLAGMDADPAYSSLAQALISSAEAEANTGHIDLAMETLNAIPSSGWVAPRGSNSFQWIIVGILAVIAAASIFLLMKARSEISFFRRQSDSQAKSLQILAKKASRIGDPSLNAGIEQMRKELEQSVGGG